MGQSAALYCRVSTADQTCARQERDLRAFAKKAGYKVAGVWKETASGTKDERAERKKVLALAQACNIDTILVTELTRWGRSISKRCRISSVLISGISAGRRTWMDASDAELEKAATYVEQNDAGVNPRFK